MKVSEKGRALIKSHEGCVLRAYKCPAGVWTIGYGSTGSHVKPNLVISKADAEALLTKDLARFEAAVSKAVAPAIPNQNEFDAMVSLSFNIGIGNFSKSSVARQFKAGNKAKAATAFGMWNKAKVKGVLTPLAGLTKRRAEEARLFLEQEEARLAPRSNSTPNRLVAVPEASVVPEAPKPLAASREIIGGGVISLGSIGSLINGFTQDDLGQAKSGVESVVAKADTMPIAQKYYVPEIASMLALVIGGFMIWKRFSDRKNGIR